MAAVTRAQARWDPRDLVDVARYPIAPLSTAVAERLVAEGRCQLDATGLCLLEGFIGPQAVKAMASDAMAARHHAHRRDVWYGIGDGYRGAAPNAHGPSTRNAMAALARDRLAPDGPLNALFAWDALTDFVGALVGETLYRTEDPLASLSTTFLGEGDEHGWHYDDNDFVVSLLLRDALDGGHFEVAPGSRDRPDARDHEKRLLAGEREGLLRPRMTPGTFSLFRGQRSLHHVSPVKGARERIIALFSYDRRPGMIFPDRVRLGAFGRLN
jgi:hypothetical protein